MNVNFKVRNIAAVQSFLRSVPRGVLKVALEAFTEYIVGNADHGLRHTEPYKYASRKAAYGVTGATFKNGKPVPAGYFSKEQYFYVMAKIAKGEITPGTPRSNRGESSKTWKMIPKQGGYNYAIVNDNPSQYWARDDYGQPRQIGNTNWRKVSKVLADNYLGAIRAAVTAVKRYLASK